MIKCQSLLLALLFFFLAQRHTNYTNLTGPNHFTFLFRSFTARNLSSQLKHFQFLCTCSLANYFSAKFHVMPFKNGHFPWLVPTFNFFNLIAYYELYYYHSHFTCTSLSTTPILYLFHQQLTPFVKITSLIANTTYRTLE